MGLDVRGCCPEAEERVALVRRAVDALNRGDLDGYAAAFHPSCRRWMAGVDEPLPAAAVVDVLRELQRCFDGFRLDADLLTSDGRYVIARWRSTGTHVAGYAGIPPTGRAISVSTCEVYEIGDDQRVVASWSYGDPNELAHQLTAASAEGGS